ncbi:hypothetical protein PVAND_001939 [Polypedilum vanderplanki]|uniref:RBR-type E3 ubiquitin transferase n=1 Tax=Polypedilum vanderplanki TaxID=319348 RepID=A0A9J6BPW9_POLVA|nr:hypothetical protein PVAND_001939 [Polypedilum vanderplanki]
MCDIDKIKEVAQLPNNLIRSLLHKFKWDTENLLEAIFTNDSLTSINNYERVPRNDNKLDCEICYDTMTDSSKIKVFDCNNCFCFECLNNYLASQISDGGLLNCIACPGFQCKYELDDDLVFQSVDLQTKEKYKKIITNSFVQNNRMIKFCPSPGCDNAIQIESGCLLSLMESVRCSCGYYFCFKCVKSSHDPISCEILEKWLKYSNNDLTLIQTAAWVAKFTKPCPNCKVSIEKNGGCDHMTCSSCGYEFYWNCLCIYRNHLHKCKKTDQIRSSNAITITKRYEIYSSKYEFMFNAYQRDEVHYGRLMNYNQEFELNEQWVKMDFIANAIEILLECRRTIMYSYVFLFYKTTIGNEIYIFENMVEELYQNTERLAYLTENKINSNNVYQFKHDVVSKTEFCQSSRKKLLNYVKEGEENKFWRTFPIPPKELLGSPVPDNFFDSYSN